MSRIGTFITGAAIGALAALLLAPKTGEQSRALVTEKASSIAGEAKGFAGGLPDSAIDALKAAQDKGAALVKDATSKGQSAVSDATSRVKNVAEGSAPAAVDNDELREKIEAARKRIAAQVMENAEQAATAAGEVAEAAAEAAE